MDIYWAALDSILSKTMELRKIDNFKKTPKGVLTNTYHRHKQRQRDKGRGKLDYSLKEFHNIFLNNIYFLKLFEDWKNSNFNKMLYPSFDRINPLKGYSLDNLQLMTWAQNRNKGYKEQILVNSSPVVQYDLNNKQIKAFNSIKEAAKQTKCFSTNISKCCTGERKTCGGFKWTYKN